MTATPPRSAIARRRLLATTAAAALCLAPPPVAVAGPEGGVVVGGAASIRQSGSVTTIDQSSNRAVIDWSSFDTDVHETTRFHQPGAGSIALNRVRNGVPTHIRGALEANGNVWVVNRSGITLHDTARIDVNGLIATTADIDNAAFMRGDDRFDRPGDPGAAVVNEGRITFGDAALVGLVGARAANRGSIVGRLGKVVVAGEHGFAVDMAGDGILALPVGGPGDTLAAANTGRIANAGGHVRISAGQAEAALDATVLADGEIEARSFDTHEGRISLSGGRLTISGGVDASGETGGEITATGDRLTITGGARIDASGRTGGGRVRIGGGYQGGGDLQAATETVVEEGATIAADARERGDGGRVILWSDDTTRFYGAISATGGAEGGDGGFAEVSGKRSLTFAGTADLRAPAGERGTLLLDPSNFTISTDPTSPNNINATDLVNALQYGNVTLDTSADNNGVYFTNAPDGTAGEAGNISVVGGLGNVYLSGEVFGTGSTLTLLADNDISVAAGSGGIVDVGNYGYAPLGLDMAAGGAITIDAPIDVAGSVSLSAQTGIFQTAPLYVGQSFTAATADGPLVLDNPNNDFVGLVSLEALNSTAGGGDTASITDQNDVSISSLNAQRVVVEADNATTALSPTVLGAGFVPTDVTLIDTFDSYGAPLNVVDGPPVGSDYSGNGPNQVDTSLFTANTATAANKRLDVVTTTPGRELRVIEVEEANLSLGLETDGQVFFTGTVPTNLRELRVVSSANIGQDAALTVSERVELQSAGEILLRQSNDFPFAAPFAPGDTVSVNATGTNIALTDANAIRLGSIDAFGFLEVVGGGTIGGSEAGLSVSGAATFTASDLAGGRFDIDLANATSPQYFFGPVVATGEQMRLVSDGTVSFGAIDLSGGGVDATLGPVLGPGNGTLYLTDGTGPDAILGLERGDLEVTAPQVYFGAAPIVAPTVLVRQTGTAVTISETLANVTADALQIEAAGPLEIDGVAPGGVGVTVFATSGFGEGTTGATFTGNDISFINQASSFSGDLRLVSGGGIGQQGTAPVTISRTTYLLAASTDPLAPAQGVDLGQAGNGFGGTLDIFATGSAAVLSDGAVRLGDVSANQLVLQAGGTIDQEGSGIDPDGARGIFRRGLLTPVSPPAAPSLRVAGATDLTAQGTTAGDFFDIVLDNPLNDFDSDAIGPATDPLSATGEDLAIADSTGLALGAMATVSDQSGDPSADPSLGSYGALGGAAGSLTVTAGGTISDTDGASISVAGPASFIAEDSAGDRFDIVLDGPFAHDFDSDGDGDGVDALGEDIVLDDLTAIRLGTVSAVADAAADPTIAGGGSLTVTAGGTISDTDGAPIGVAGPASFTAEDRGGNFHDIGLDAPDLHDFAGPVSARGEDVILDDLSDIVLGTVRAFESGEDGNTAGADPTISFFDGNGDGVSDAGDSFASAGDLTVRAGGSITDTGTGPITVDGLTRLDAGPGDVVLDNGLHDFDANAPSGIAAQWVDAVGANVFLSDTNTISLGAITASGALIDANRDRSLDPPGLAPANLVVSAGGSIRDTSGRRIEVPGSSLFEQTGGITFGDAPATGGAFDLVLSNSGGTESHIFGPQVQVAGIRGNVTFFEEATSGAVDDTADFARLAFVDLTGGGSGALQALGDIRIASSDQIRFETDITLNTGSELRIVTADNFGLGTDPAAKRARDSVLFLGSVAGHAASALPDLRFDVGDGHLVFADRAGIANGGSFGRVEILSAHTVTAGAAPGEATPATALATPDALAQFFPAIDAEDPSIAFLVGDGATGFSDFFRAVSLAISGTDGAIRFPVPQGDAEAMLEDNTFFGVDLSTTGDFVSFFYEDDPGLTLRGFGAIDGVRTQEAALLIDGVGTPERTFNLAVVGEVPPDGGGVGDESSLLDQNPIQEAADLLYIPTLNAVKFRETPVFDIPLAELSSLFSGIGNEALWDLRPNAGPAGNGPQEE